MGALLICLCGVIIICCVMSYGLCLCYCAFERVGYMCSCVVFVTLYAMLYDVCWGVFVFLCVVVFLLTVLGCRVCEFEYDDA